MRKQIQDKNFVTIPGWVVNSLHITGDDAIVYSLILGYKDGFQEPLSYIAAWTSCEERKIQRILRRFVADGLVEELRASGKPTLYKCTDKMDTMGCLTDTPYTQKGCPTDTPTPVTRTPHIPQRGVPQTPHPCHTDTPHLIDIYNIYNNNNNINECAPAHTCTREEEASGGMGVKEQIIEWLMDNEEGMTILLRKNSLLDKPKTTEELRKIIAPYVDEYYALIQITGKEDIERRGRQEVKQHFAAWLRKYINYQQSQQNNGNNHRGNQTSGTREGVPYDEFAKQFLVGFNSGKKERGG